MRWPPGRHDRRLGQREAAQAVVVAAHRDHGRDPSEVVEHRGDAQVAGVEDQVAAVERREDGIGERVDELADVGVGDHADARAPPQQR